MPTASGSGSIVNFWRYLWAAPNSALGLVLALIGVARGGRLSVIDGVLEAEGRLLAWGLTHLTLLEQGAAAITFGHVVLARNAAALEQTRAHERIHVRQGQSIRTRSIRGGMATA